VINRGLDALHVRDMKPRTMKGMKIHGGVQGRSPDNHAKTKVFGGVSPRDTKGGGPNGNNKHSNSAPNATQTLLRKAQKMKERITRDEERQKRTKRGPSPADLRRSNTFKRF